MIGSVSDFQRDIAELERRRQQIAAQQAAPQQVPPMAAVAPPLAGGVPAAGCTPAAALKGAEPDVTKRRKNKERGDRKGRDLRTDPLTDAHEAAQAGDGEDARKAFRDRGITEGPGNFSEPGKAEPEQFDRPYESGGHAAESPMAEPPRENPVPAPYGRGFPVPIQMSDAPMAAGIPSHIAGAYSLGSPSER